MRIALLGYGKMGKSIESLAVSKHHEIVLATNDTPDFTVPHNIDVAIEFSTPETAFYNLKSCIEHRIPVVCGTTGWLDKFNEAKKLSNLNKSKFLYASNFSIGVNLFFKLNEQLATLMKNHKDYGIELTEIHHLQKLDSPSGTAISLAEQIIEHSKYKSWSHPPILENNNKTDIPITALREKGIFGTHIINYNSDIDSISIKHEANSRKGFALGALIAAEWLVNSNKFGTFTMTDVLDL